MESAQGDAMESEDPCRVVIGSGFIEVDSMDVDELIDKKLKEAQEEKQEIEQKYTQTRNQMLVLKRQLDSKFGKQIKLDFE